MIKSEWNQLIAVTSPQSFHLLSTLSARKASDFADTFYSYMLNDRDASFFLSSQQVHDRLHGAMTTWIVDILTNTGERLPDLIEQQKKIGEIHARIGIPVDLVERGARRLKWRLNEEILQVAEDKALCFDAMRFAATSMDIAIEIMSKSYSQSHNIDTKNEESYRLFSILENAGIESARQNASLLHWENTFIFSVATGTPLSSIQDLNDSDFALWFNHKGKSNFSNVQRVKTISDTIIETDKYIHDYSCTPGLISQDYAPLLKTVRSKIHKINTLLGSLFDEVQKLESGKDTLTLLLNRRFLPTILRHEISLAMHSRIPLSIAMIDIDNFKTYNDTYGHADGDNILKKVAEMLYDSTRSSDYIFRLGGEEFLIVLVETAKTEAFSIIEQMRKKIQDTPVQLHSHEYVHVTVSAGIAVYNGHPDYECLIRVADNALYQAKANGKNRIEYAQSE
ncbi:diguanylate cyclase [Citrobacter sp. JGM124]|uniref:diguanylate cyclase n=1 Tax=Citrobacter sp. JGM124 TaxID=2799789 RepID=UPI00201243BA|nr:diguanylate cyclase [Citrobacter sp. JGM124]